MNISPELDSIERKLCVGNEETSTLASFHLDKSSKREEDEENSERNRSSRKNSLILVNEFQQRSRCTQDSNHLFCRTNLKEYRKYLLQKRIHSILQCVQIPLSLEPQIYGLVIESINSRIAAKNLKATVAAAIFIIMRKSYMLVSVSNILAKLDLKVKDICHVLERIRQKFKLQDIYHDNTKSYLLKIIEDIFSHQIDYLSFSSKNLLNTENEPLMRNNCSKNTFSMRNNCGKRRMKVFVSSEIMYLPKKKIKLKEDKDLDDQNPPQNTSFGTLDFKKEINAEAKEDLKENKEEYYGGRCKMNKPGGEKDSNYGKGRESNLNIRNSFSNVLKLHGGKEKETLRIAEMRKIEAKVKQLSLLLLRLPFMEFIKQSRTMNTVTIAILIIALKPFNISINFSNLDFLQNSRPKIVFPTIASFRNQIISTLISKARQYNILPNFECSDSGCLKRKNLKSRGKESESKERFKMEKEWVFENLEVVLVELGKLCWKEEEEKNSKEEDRLNVNGFENDLKIKIEENGETDEKSLVLNENLSSDSESESELKSSDFLKLKSNPPAPLKIQSKPITHKSTNPIIPANNLQWDHLLTDVLFS